MVIINNRFFCGEDISIIERERTKEGEFVNSFNTYAHTSSELIPRFFCQPFHLTRGIISLPV